MQRLAAAEFVGTMLVMLGGPGLMILAGDEIGSLGVAVGFGLSIAVSIGAIGAVANPMFSLALWFSTGITRRELLGDLVGQLHGAVVGAAIIFGLNDTTRFATGTNGWAPGRIAEGVDLGMSPSGFADLGVVLAAELALGTMVVVVLLSSISRQRSDGAVAAFTGAATALATLFLLGISGAGVNPARSVGTAIFADTDPNALGQVWAFVVIPVCAAFAGTLVWLMIDDATIDDTIFDDTFLEDISDAVTNDSGTNDTG